MLAREIDSREHELEYAVGGQSVVGVPCGLEPGLASAFAVAVGNVRPGIFERLEHRSNRVLSELVARADETDQVALRQKGFPNVLEYFDIGGLLGGDRGAGPFGGRAPGGVRDHER